MLHLTIQVNQIQNLSISFIGEIRVRKKCRQCNFVLLFYYLILKLIKTLQVERSVCAVNYKLCVRVLVTVVLVMALWGALPDGQHSQHINATASGFALAIPIIYTTKTPAPPALTEETSYLCS